MQRRPSRVTGLAAVLAALLLATISPMASAAPVRFGARLDDQTQPDGGTQTCRNASKSCTWIQAEAYQRADGLHAPKDGRITKIRVIAGNKGGSFRPVLARIKNNGDSAKVVVRGTSLSYAKQPDLDPPYVVQVFSVNLVVHQGDVLGIEAKSTSLLRCSGANLPQFQPALAVGGGFRSQTGDTGCYLLIEAQYG
jgi:hypothetical protein